MFAFEFLFYVKLKEAIFVLNICLTFLNSEKSILTLQMQCMQYINVRRQKLLGTLFKNFFLKFRFLFVNKMHLSTLRIQPNAITLLYLNVQSIDFQNIPEKKHK